MLLQHLTVNNFGVFRGQHSFELAPRSKDGRDYHLTIFSGHNGAGKTTLFQAMIFALHGAAYFEGAAISQKYSNFILSRMHRFSDIEKRQSDSESSVTLSFQYVKSGRLYNIQIARQWKRQGRGVRENLTVLQDGRPPEVDSIDYQVWINDFISPEVGQICFFDAEHLDALANKDQQNTVLRETLARLLGLDWGQHLEVDLEQLMIRQGSTRKLEHLYTKVLEAQVARDNIDDQLTQLRWELEEINSDISSCETALAQQDRLLAAEGGSYAARRPMLQDRLPILQKDVELLSNQLRDLCGELLPFALVPELCVQLSKRLIAEFEIRRQHSLSTLLQEKLPEIEAMLSEENVWEEQNISPQSRRYIVEKLTEKLKTFAVLPSSNNGRFVYHLSGPEYQQLRRWIPQVVHDVPKEVQFLGRKLRATKEELRRIEADLQRAPDEAILAPIHAEISRLRGILLTKQKRHAALNEQIGSLQFQRDEKQRGLQEAIAQYDKLRKVEKELRYAERTKIIMRTYKDVLIRQKLLSLEEALITSFNKICRKEHLLSKVHIDPEEFDIQLENVDGTALKLDNFSAGERQLYAMALLWALRQVSKIPLPLVIDTPLARLDGTHRLRFIHDYVPIVSDQVLLFTTDAELDASLLTQAEPYLARIYRLQHVSERGETTVLYDDMVTSNLMSREEVKTYGI